ncbi:glycosyltransferase family 1 protein [Devosia sp. SD17-2]|uniref:glycosyltransferase family 4 protein n=1 Tax=Devosia sp. SD17-2 TaxID=2976459 RepID=UPI0023D8B30F|nr:glycosyltransferase family 1 protein [Devosia sp. SD17-2]WEJ32916.1 glycosyltransferase family 4 protein [Devosia sp. SD17-2]
MKIVLSIQSLKYPLTGIGRYTLELAQQLAANPEVEQLDYFNGDRFVPALPERDAMETAPSAAASGLLAVKRQLARSKLVLETYRALKSLRRSNPFAGHEGQLFHGPNFYVPDFPGPRTVTIHDLSVLTMPQFHPPERVLYLGKEIEISLQRTNTIITDCEAIKDEVIQRFGVAASDVFVAPLASSEIFHARDNSETARALARYGLTHGGYTLYTGTIEPRKNLVNLIDAYEKLPAPLRAQKPLVLSGHRGWQNEAIMERIERAQRQGWLTYLGFVPEEDLPILFSGAYLFAFPSLYEGFGLPVLEAMASGVPVVTSNRSSLPEVGGDAALFVEPEDVTGISEALERALTDTAWREAAIAGGFAQAQKFSWEKCAADTLTAYRATIAR